MLDALATTEHAKYEAMWSHPEYRRYSPGEVMADAAQAIMQVQPGETLADFGAGTGRAARWFQARGAIVTAIDFVDGALEADVPFKRACLWSMPRRLGPFDVGYCTDVMEHIPPEMVDAVLAGIAGKVRRGCFFQIATFPDAMGALIGQRLHLTVQPMAWWVERLMAHFGALKAVRENGGHLSCMALH